MVRDWRGMRAFASRLLVEATGQDLDAWNRRVVSEGPSDEKILRVWLAQRGVTGFTQSYLVVERFGYPDNLAVTGHELLDGQFDDRPALRPVYDAIVDAAASQGAVTVHARKSHALLYTPLRLFARIESPAPDRIDLHLRLDSGSTRERLQAPDDHGNLGFKVTLRSVEDLDARTLGWIREAYAANL